MTDNSCVFMLRLEGPLQSWGEYGKWSLRETATFPTKSGIVGIIASAMGAGREDPILAELSNAIRIAIRADRPGSILNDFHTVSGDYSAYVDDGKSKSRPSEGSIWLSDKVFLEKSVYTMIGEKKEPEYNTIVTERMYLEDASFYVFVKTTDEWRKRIADALWDPVWTPFLGRKCCIPSRPILASEYTDYYSLNEAIKDYPTTNTAPSFIPYETEEKDDSLSRLSRPDVFLPGYRCFGRRTVWRGAIRKEDLLILPDIREVPYVPVAD